MKLVHVISFMLKMEVENCGWSLPVGVRIASTINRIYRSFSKLELVRIWALFMAPAALSASLRRNVMHQGPLR